MRKQSDERPGTPAYEKLRQETHERYTRLLSVVLLNTPFMLYMNIPDFWKI